MLPMPPSAGQPQAMPGRHRRIPSSTAAEEVSTFGVVQESTKPCEQDPTGRYVRYPMLLGRGACKRVFRAFDCEEGKEVAWNQVELAGVQITEETRNRLFAEIHVLQRLHHKNIMSFMSYFYNPKLQTINFITELFMSGTLRQYRKKVCVMNENILKRWAWQILEGLVYLHGHDPPIVHRDLKCDNIFVNGNTGQIKIGDLGYATAQQGLSVVGTPEFMAPEIYEEKYDHKVDIYSFGMCLLELATLEFPYSECHGVAHIFRKVTQGIKPQALQRVQSEQLRQIIELCIAHDPEQRPEARRLLKHPYFAQLREQGSLMLGAGSQYSSTPNLSALPHSHAADSTGLPVTQQHRRPMGGLGAPSNFSSHEAGGRAEAAVPPSRFSPAKADLGAGAAAGGGPEAAPAPRAGLSSGPREGSTAASLPPRGSCAEGCSGSNCTHAPAGHGFASALLRREASLKPQQQLHEAGLPGLARLSADARALGDAAVNVVVGSQPSGALGLSGDAGDSQADASSPTPVKQLLESLSHSLDRRDRLHQSVDLSQLAQQLHKYDSCGPRSGTQGAERDDAMSESSSDEVVIIPLQCLASMDFSSSRGGGDDAASELQLDGLAGTELPEPGLQRDSRSSVVMLSSATSLMSPVSTHSSPTASRAASAALRPPPPAARNPSPSLFACRSAPALRKAAASGGGELELPPLSPCSSAGPALSSLPPHAHAQGHGAVTRNRSIIAIPHATHVTSVGQEDAPSPPSPPAVHPPAAGTGTASSQPRPTVCVESSFYPASTQPMITTPVCQPVRSLVPCYTEPFASISYTGGHQGISYTGGHQGIAEAMHSFADALQPPAPASPGSRRHHANVSSPQIMLPDEELQQAESSGSASRPIHGIIVRLKQCKGQGFRPTMQRDRLRRATTM